MLSSLTQETATMMEKKYSYNEGKVDGVREGMEKGIQQGMEKGIEKGQNVVVDVLKKFKSGAVSIVDAAKALNMTQEEFKELVR